MDISASISRGDLRHLQRTLKRIADRYDEKTARNTLGELLKAAGEPFVEKLRSGTPVDKGTLVGSVSSKIRRRRGSTWLEMGYIARGSKEKKLRTIFAALALEYGAEGTKKRETIEKTLRRTEGTIVQRFTSAIRNDLEGFARKLQAEDRARASRTT